MILDAQGSEKYEIVPDIIVSRLFMRDRHRIPLGLLHDCGLVDFDFVTFHL